MPVIAGNGARTGPRGEGYAVGEVGVSIGLPTVSASRSGAGSRVNAAAAVSIFRARTILRRRRLELVPACAHVRPDGAIEVISEAGQPARPSRAPSIVRG